MSLRDCLPMIQACWSQLELPQPSRGIWHRSGSLLHAVRRTGPARPASPLSEMVRPYLLKAPSARRGKHPAGQNRLMRALCAAHRCGHAPVVALPRWSLSLSICQTAQSGDYCCGVIPTTRTIGSVAHILNPERELRQRMRRIARSICTPLISSLRTG